MTAYAFNPVVSSVAIGPSVKLLFTGSHDYTVRAWPLIPNDQLVEAARSLARAASACA